MKKYMARIVFEAETPLHVGSGSSDLTLDAPVNCDANGLPQINGASLAGVIRSYFTGKKEEKEFVDKIFGFQDNKGAGSRLVVSNAHMVYDGGKVVEGLITNDKITKNTYLKAMQAYALPLRDHCRINEKGSAADKGKFDNCVLPKGIRFMCELELTENDEDLSQDWEKLLKVVCSDTFRVGGKVRSGLGRLAALKLIKQVFDFNNGKDAESYLNRSSSFNAGAGEWENGRSSGNSDNYFCYTLDIKPENFFTFGSGYGDKDVDMTPKKEILVEWKNDTPEIIEANILVPASSVKGAVSHRTAFYYNKLTNKFAGKVNPEDVTGTNNEAVQILFGYDKQGKAEAGNPEVAAGKVFFDDMIIEENVEEKVFNHVSIDRFTGGAMNGALFDEKVCGNGAVFEPMKIYVEKSAFEGNVNVRKAFEKALEDICTGMLPLGGSTMRGHGCFTGTLVKPEGDNE